MLGLTIQALPVACVCTYPVGEGIEIVSKGPGGMGRRGSTGEACGLGLSTQWRTTGEALPPAHAGLAAGPQVSMHPPPLSMSSISLSLGPVCGVEGCLAVSFVVTVPGLPAPPSGFIVSQAG